jgi:phage shock protein PspC (stress-responsive transcriptional regulator)
MSERLKIFLLVALLGFIAGVIAQLAADYAIPWLVTVVPALIQIRFLVSGLAGAGLTLVLLSVWAYVTGPTQR